MKKQNIKKIVKNVKKLVETAESPMGDNEIRKYLPNAKIMTTKDLNKFTNIDELFDSSKPMDYVIILFLDSPNSGHWTVLSKYGNIIEFFDSYGNNPDQVYNFVPLLIRRGLGTQNKKLVELLNGCDYNVIYNPVKYQEDNKKEMDINTCGRHCILRILSLLKKGKILPEYYKMMQEAKKKYNVPWDAIVSKLIDE